MCADEADVPHGAISDDSFTTDDEDTAAVSGKQMWAMSFEWQDESVPDATDTCTSFEESADFGRLPGFSHQTSTSSTTDSKSESAEPSPRDPDCDWIQPWSASPASTAPAFSKEQSQSYHASTENQPQPQPKVEPMSDEHKTAILGKTQNLCFFGQVLACLPDVVLSDNAFCQQVDSVTAYSVTAHA